MSETPLFENYTSHPVNIITDSGEKFEYPTSGNVRLKSVPQKEIKTLSNGI